MDEKTKKRLMFLGTLFVAIAFISSYAAFDYNLGTTTTTTTSIPGQRTFFVSGTTNGTVSAYSQGATVILNKSVNATTGNEVVAILSNLEANGTINNYLQQNNSFQVALSSINAYALQGLLHKKLDSNQSTSVNATSYVLLPGRMSLYLNTQSVAVTLTQTNFTINLYPLSPTGTRVKLKINALVYQNGTVIPGQLTLSKD